MARSKRSIYLKLNRPFVGLPVDTILSKELNCLKPHSRWLYVVLLTRFNRDRKKVDAYYEFTYKDIQKITGYDDRRILACLTELKDHDFVDIDPGGRNNPSTYKPVKKWL